MDVHSPATRSYNMSRIKSKDTRPEMLVRRYLHAHGYRYRLHVKDMPGKPDIVLPKHKTVIFVHGCFWHGHEGCRYYVVPKTRTEWWLEKMLRNKQNIAIIFANICTISHVTVACINGHSSKNCYAHKGVAGR